MIEAICRTWRVLKKFKLRAPRIGFNFEPHGPRHYRAAGLRSGLLGPAKPGRRYIFLMESENC